MQKALLKMGQELNREIIEELKESEEDYTPESFKKLKKQLNQDRIKALGMYLIKGGKDD